MRLIGAAAIALAMATSAHADSGEIAKFKKGAFEGDYQSQRDLAYCLSNRSKCTGETNDGPIEACAWRLVIVASNDKRVMDGDWSNFVVYCRDVLNEQDLKYASLRAGAYFSKIYKRSIPVSMVRALTYSSARI